MKAAGFDAILKQSGGFYKVQTGAYSKKENANAEVVKLKAKGFDAIVTTNGGSAAGSANSEIKVGERGSVLRRPSLRKCCSFNCCRNSEGWPGQSHQNCEGSKAPVPYRTH